MFAGDEQVPGQKHPDHAAGQPDAGNAVPSVRAGPGQLDSAEQLGRHSEQPVRRGEDAGGRHGVLHGRAAQELDTDAAAGPDHRQLPGLRRVRRAGVRARLPEDQEAEGGHEARATVAARVPVLQTLFATRRRPDVRGRRPAAQPVRPDHHDTLRVATSRTRKHGREPNAKRTL